MDLLTLSEDVSTLEDTIDRMQETFSFLLPKITKLEWSKTHPDAITSGSDEFYAQIASTLLSRFQLITPDQKFPNGFLLTAAKCIAAYYEDTISNLGIWQVVRNIYKRQYGNILPFYEVDEDDYFSDDINIQDLRLIIWMVMTRTGDVENIFFSPISQGVMVMAEFAFNLLVDKFEEAKEATMVRDYIKMHFVQAIILL